MSKHYNEIKRILEELREDYMNEWKNKESSMFISERDILSEIYLRFKKYCQGKDIEVHTEVKPTKEGKRKIFLKGDKQKRNEVDVVILGGEEWFNEAIKHQEAYIKGPIEARFSNVPIEHFEVAIEVKIQSFVYDSYNDIEKLKQISQLNNNCDCFLVLLNARGRKEDHIKIISRAKETGVEIIEYTKNLDYSKNQSINLSKEDTPKPTSASISSIKEIIQKTINVKDNESIVEDSEERFNRQVKSYSKEIFGLSKYRKSLVEDIFSAYSSSKIPITHFSKELCNNARLKNVYIYPLVKGYIVGILKREGNYLIRDRRD